MLIHALDQGRRMGRAMGLAGQVPLSGFVELRQPKEERDVAYMNLARFLEHTWERRLPDLVVWEEPMGAAWWAGLAMRTGKMNNADSLEAAHEMSGTLMTMCKLYQRPYQVVRRQTVLKFMTGTSKHGSREAGKKAIIAACVRMGLVEASCKDDDRCDAVANFVYASSVFARRQVGDFKMFT